DGEDSNSRMELTSSINDGVVTINCVESENDKEIINVTITVEPVELTDIEVPTDNVYSVGDKEQLKAYIESADVDGFFANIKSVLGDELYEKLFGEEDEDEDENDPVVDPDDIDSDITPLSKSLDTANVVKNTADGGKSDGANNKTTTTNKDASPNTGATGITFAIAALAGCPILISKKK
ncbi:MAG: NPXTG-anchored protein, partial [Ruminococcus sp.]|nr:NPXTG-anchored protein [Ruminococcus sp.]